MRPLLRCVAVMSVVVAGWAAPPPLAQAASLDTVADRVIGQMDFTSNSPNGDGLARTDLSDPLGVALDKHGNLYVVDSLNNRVLEYDAPLNTHAAADRVFGQPDFTHGGPNQGGLSARSLNRPVGVALDGQGNLFVADLSNNRVLEYIAPLSTDSTADRVFGQPDFTHADANSGGLSARSLFSPVGVALDAAGNLYVTDQTNNRVLEYNAPLNTHAAADRVLGQADFTHNDINHGGLNASALFMPNGLALDAAGDVYVCDGQNNRVLEYDTPLTSDRAADQVFGQGGSFTTNTNNNGGLSANSLSVPEGLALDEKGNLYIGDSNNRVLEYNTPLTSGTTADRVFGQPDFIHNDPNNGGISASRLDAALAATVDASGNLWVADTANNRVLEYETPSAHNAPVLIALGPSRVAAGSPDFSLTVNGSGFYGDSVVRWNGSSRPTTFLSSSQLTAAISAADLAGAGPFPVTVFTPAPGGGTSTIANLVLYGRVGHDLLADVAQGQPSLLVNTINNPNLPSPNRLNLPGGVAVASAAGRLFVADSQNNRVLSWPNAPAFANGQPADLVLGQPDFVNTAANSGGRSARSLSNPRQLALDAAGDLYVADGGNSRVLVFTAPLTSSQAASQVFGQGGSFTTGVSNDGGVTATSLGGANGVAVDALGNVYVADFLDNRVLEYNTPLAAGGDRTADRVFGQPNFGASLANNGGVSASSLATPVAAALDGAGNLFVVDTQNNRVLEYNTPLAAGADRVADRVFGQPNLGASQPNNGGVSANSLSNPQGVALDPWGNLYVADFGNSRVLEYDAPLANHTADRVFGQPNFGANTANNGGVRAYTLSSPAAVALDARGNLYVADSFNSRALEYDWARVKIHLPLVLR